MPCAHPHPFAQRARRCCQIPEGFGRAAAGGDLAQDAAMPQTDTTLPPALDLSVLVVDDETGVRELIARWLASGGYDVRTASCADEALERVHDAAPAVAVCDVRMPGHDGLWLAKHIRDEAPETAVIMATGVQDVG